MTLEVDGLAYTYPSGVTALQAVSFQVAQGEAVAIVGQNGAGKTTLVKHFNGLLRPTTGRVRVGGWEAAQRSIAQLAAVVGYVFQNPDDQLFQASVAAEVQFGPRNLGQGAAQSAARARAALERVGLGAAAERHPYDLSFSQRKLVALAAVLAMETPIVVLDEPTTGQDYRGTALIGGIVDDLRRAGRTVLAVAHDIDFCAEHFQRTIVMGQGRLLLDGPTRAVLAQAGVLAQTDVEPPQIARLAEQLAPRQGPLPVTVEEFVDDWLPRPALSAHD